MKELLFAQRLADNEKKVRDRALKKLKKYLSIKSSSDPPISHDEALKLWKGLFYCMYMADKPLVQEDVAEHISSLIHSINNEESCKTFIRAGFLTFAREWNGIDVFRIEKYMMFVRRFLRHIFKHLEGHGWSLKEVLAYTSILEMTVVCPDDDVNKTPLGLKTHVCEIILEELAKIGGENLQHSVIMAMIQPYFKVLALTKIGAYTRFVREGIIHHLIHQRLCAEVEEEENETTEDKQIILDGEDSVMEDIEHGERDEVPSLLDPRAGKVDTYIPQLNVDFNLLADSLQKIGAVSRIQTKNREVIYRLVCELRDAAQGCNPLALPDDHVDDTEVPDIEVEKALERLEKFEEDLKTGKAPSHEASEDDDLKTLKKQKTKSKYRKKKYFGLKKRNQKPKGLSKVARRKLDKRQKELVQKRAKAVDHMVRQVSAASGVPKKSLFVPTLVRQADKAYGFEVSPVSRKKKSSSTATSTNSFIVEVASDGKKKRGSAESMAKSSKKKCFDVSVLDFKSNEESGTSCAEKSKNEDNSPLKRALRNSVKSEDFISTKTKVKESTQLSDMPKTELRSDEPVQNSKLKVVEDIVNQHTVLSNNKKDAQETKAKIIRGSGSSERKGRNQKRQSSRHSKAKSPWDEPLQNGEYEIYVKSRKQVTTSKKRKISPIKLVNISLENNGHALNVKLEPPPLHPPRVSGGGLTGKYVLDAFHFHWGKRYDEGSEHMLMGCSFSGEMHFVHFKEEYGTVKEALKHPDGLAVLGVWLRESWSDPESISDLLVARADKYLAGAVGWRGEDSYQYTAEEHAAAAYYWLTNLSPSSATIQDAHVHVHLRQLLPLDDSTFYRYDGSLTTPPCTENVRWTIFQDSVVLPRPLLQGLRLLTTPVPPENVDHTLADNDIAHSLSNNYRPTQPLGNRTVYFSGSMAKRTTTCAISRPSRTSCLVFPEVVVVQPSSEEDVCHLGPLDLHLRDAQVVVSPTLNWKRVGSCRTVSVVNSGDIIKVRYSKRSPQWQLTGSNLTGQYYLGEIVLRLGSKHLLGGLSFPLEIQLLHYNAKYKDMQEAINEPDGVVVVVKFFQEPMSAWGGARSKQLFSGHNKNLHNIIEAIEEEKEETRAKSPDVRHLMDSTSSYYEYSGPFPGSFCNISITWLIIRKSSHVSRDQLGRLDDLLEENLFTAHALEPRVPPVLLLRVTTPQLATEYRSILSATPKEYITWPTSAVSNAASTLQAAADICCYSWGPSKLLLLVPVIAAVAFYM